jgi:adenylate kinase
MEVFSMKVILIGPPGAGKGTQAKLLSKEFNIPHISTGDIFRKNIRENTSLGIEAKAYMDRGMLVPDELTLRIVYDRLLETDCRKCYLLDGFPRTLNQAEAFQKLLESDNKSIDNVILLKVPKKIIIERGTGRRICSSCGASYHISLNPPLTTNTCNNCGGTLIQRPDDTEETISNRLELYERETMPLIDFYRDKNLLTAIDGTLAIESVFKVVNNLLVNNTAKKGA